MDKVFKKTLLSYFLFTLGFALVGCKSDVEERHLEQQSPIQIDSLKLHQTTAIRDSLASQALVKSKSYTIQACLSEATLGQKLNFQTVRLEGAELVNSQTDNNGCVFWKHQVEHTITTGKRCQFFQTKLIVEGSNFSKDLKYSIDVMNDSLADQMAGQTCQEIAEDKNQEELKSSDSSDSKDSGNLVLEEINLLWAGNNEMIRSDERYHTHKTKMTSCLKSSYTNEAVPNTKVNLSVKNHELDDEEYSTTVTTDSRGCFELLFDTKYKQFVYSHWAKHSIKLDVVSGVLSGSSVTNDFYINSWEIDRSFFGIDPRFASPRDNPQKVNNSVFIDSVMYIQIGNDLKNFHVNDKLGLTVSRSYQVVLTPRIDRGHTFGSSATRYAKPSDGKFKLKFMLLAPNKAEIELTKENFKDFQFITGASKVVEVRNGVINELIDIPVRMTDLPRVATRTVAVLKLEPLDNVVDLLPTTVTGFFKSKITWIRTNVLQSNDLQSSVQDLANQIKKSSAVSTSNTEKFFSDIEGQNFDKDFVNKVSELKLKASTEEETEAFKSLEYKAVIEMFFKNLETEVQRKIQDTSPLIKDVSPLELFFNNLKKDYKDIKLLYSSDSKNAQKNQYDTLSFDDQEIDSILDQAEFKKAEETHPIFRTLCDKEFENTNPNLLEWANGKINRNKHCKKKPFKYFDIARYQHADKVTSSSPQFSKGYHIGVNTSFSSSETFSESRGVSYRAGIRAPLGDFFGAGVDLSYSKSDSFSDGYSDTLSTSHNIAVEEFQIDVYGKFKSCYLIAPKVYKTESECSPGHYQSRGICTKKDVTHFKTKSNYYLCSSSRETMIKEPWYFIESYSSTSNLFTDGFGPTEVKLLKVMRGKKQFNAFRSLLEDNTHSYVISRTNGVSDAAEKLYEDWGHILTEDVEPSIFNELIFRDFQAGFPGTVY